VQRLLTNQHPPATTKQQAEMASRESDCQTCCTSVPPIMKRPNSQGNKPKIKKSLSPIILCLVGSCRRPINSRSRKRTVTPTSPINTITPISIRDMLSGEHTAKSRNGITHRQQWPKLLGANSNVNAVVGEGCTELFAFWEVLTPLTHSHRRTRAL
jgi:hypothetical protein